MIFAAILLFTIGCGVDSIHEIPDLSVQVDLGVPDMSAEVDFASIDLLSTSCTPHQSAICQCACDDPAFAGSLTPRSLATAVALLCSNGNFVETYEINGYLCVVGIRQSGIHEYECYDSLGQLAASLIGYDMDFCLCGPPGSGPGTFFPNQGGYNLMRMCLADGGSQDGAPSD